MMFKLLDENSIPPDTIIMMVVLIVLIVLVVVFYVFSSKKRKKQEEEAQALIDAVKPGNKVKTIGGICGIVIEVDAEENTFVLETGTELSGKSYIKFDKLAIYQTDAKPETATQEQALPADSDTQKSDNEKVEEAKDSVAQEEKKD